MTGRRLYEAVGIRGPAAGTFAWNLLGQLKAQGTPARLLAATGTFGPGEFKNFLEQQWRIVIVASIGRSAYHMAAVDRGYMRVSLLALSPTTARIESHPDESKSDTEINLAMTADLAGLFARGSA